MSDYQIPRLEEEIDRLRWTVRKRDDTIATLQERLHERSDEVQALEEILLVVRKACR